MLTFFHNLKIKNKILAINSIILAFILVISGMSFWSLMQLQQNTEEITDNWMPSMKVVGDLARDLTYLRVVQFRHTLETGPAEMIKLEENQIKNTRQALFDGLDHYQKMVTNDEDRTLFLDLKAKINDYMTVAKPVYALSRAGRTEEASKLMRTVTKEKYDAATEAASKLVQFNTQGAEACKKNNEASFNTSVTILVSCILVVIGLMIFVSLWFASVLNKPIKAINDIANALAKGDLTRNIELTHTRDELGEVTSSFHTMVKNLRDLINSLKQSICTVASASEELSASSTQIQKAAEEMLTLSDTSVKLGDEMDHNIQDVASAVEQASSNIQGISKISDKLMESNQVVGAAADTMSSEIQTIAASTEQMSSSVKSVSSSVDEISISMREIASNATEAAKVAGKAEETAGKTRETIKSLKEAADEISKVLEIIRSLAAQTNLLALNATIEAASAGEAGKGFAVVANEVKDLAKRSADSTEQIRDQIEEIQRTTDDSVRAIETIASIITNVNQYNQTIASAVEEQSAIVNNISINVNSLSEAANEVSHAVQSSAAKSNDVAHMVIESNKSIHEIAENLDELSSGTNEITMNAGSAAQKGSSMSQGIKKVYQSSNETNQGIGDIKTTADRLAGLASDLEGMVSQFQLA